MGKRVAVPAELDYVTPPLAVRTIRKRKRPWSTVVASTAAKAKCLRLGGASNGYWNTEHRAEQEDDGNDEDSSSNDAATASPVQNYSNKQANNSSILRNASLFDTCCAESPKPAYTLDPSVVNGTILYDLLQKPWRLGRPIGKGNFGEIFLASDNITLPVSNQNAKYVVKIEPHSNGPLFVEIHCLINTAKNASNVKSESHISGATKRATTLVESPQSLPSGIPDYIASGSHYFGEARYRFLVLQRYDCDLHSLIKNSRVAERSVLTLAIQIVDVLERLHDKGYCHNDVKAQNLMISKCKYYRNRQESTTSSSASTASSSGCTKTQPYDYDEKQQTTDSGNSSEQEGHEDDDATNEAFVIKRHPYAVDDEDEDFDECATSNNSSSLDMFQTPLNRTRRIRRARSNAATVEYSGSNPVRSCRRQKRNVVYDEMVKSHYLRPNKRISYAEMFNEDGVDVKGNEQGSCQISSSDDESEEFVPHLSRRSAKKSPVKSAVGQRRTRRQEKLAASLGAAGTISTGSQQQHIQRASAPQPAAAVVEERIFLIDFGLASKFADNGVHRPFVMDQRRAHDGTLEFTSRDAHMGAHSRRSDLECLGYNLIYWVQGYLPWKEAAALHQQEKVHRAKEYLMTDVREMLAQIYGKLVPKYLGEFLHHVGRLAYHDRPDYALYKSIFEREYEQLGHALADIRLDSREITRTCVRFDEALENKSDLFELCKSSGQKNVLSIMKNLSVGTPFHERTLSNRVSPKNLRSKSANKSAKKKKFSWAEILSQDPDQIARERAEKEFDREEESCDVQQPIMRKYKGRATYAILEIERRLHLAQEDAKQETTITAAMALAIETARKSTNESLNDSVKEESEEEEDDTEDEEEEDVEMAEYDSSNVAKSDNEDETTEEEDETTEEEDEASEEEDEQAPYGHSEKTDEQESTDTEASVASTRIRDAGGRFKASADVAGAPANKFTAKNTNAAVQRKSKGRGKRTTTTTISTKTTKSQAAAAAAVKTNSRRSTALHNKRDCGTRLVSGRQAGSVVASAAGETGNRRDALASDGGAKRSQRSTRRCLTKTAETNPVHKEEEENSGNCDPHMHSLFNVWSKISRDQPIYLRGASNATGGRQHNSKK